MEPVVVLEDEGESLVLVRSGAREKLLTPEPPDELLLPLLPRPAIHGREPRAAWLPDLKSRSPICRYW